MAIRDVALAATLAALAAALAAGLVGTAHAQAMPPGFGPAPALPEPQRTLIPTLNAALAKPWPKGAKPIAAAGLAVNAYATGLTHPRWLYVLPNGDVLVAETNAPPKPDDSPGIRGMVQKQIMKKAGAGGDSANRITLLRGVDAGGASVTRTVFLEGLHSPFGMALVGHELYVADSDAVLRFPYVDGQTSIGAHGVKVLDLPAGTINHHWTKNIVASPDGKRLFISVGSNSNAGENGMDKEDGRAAIWQLDRASGKAHVYANGLRNPVGMAFQPQSGALWVAVNERDELGDELVPDYMTAVRDGAFYGWPYSYYGQNLDNRPQPPQPELVKTAIAPDYALGPHTASLGLAFYTGTALPQYKNGALVGQHGSWNRKVRSGYKLIYVPFSEGKPSGPPQDVLTGFLSAEGAAQGRPVGVAVDKAGAILLADDVGDTVWRVTAAAR